jgi:hypothetical protein
MSFESFGGLDQVCIDASSLIYLLRAGALGFLAQEATLHTTAEVADETGWPRLPVHIVDSAASMSDTSAGAASKGVAATGDDGRVFSQSLEKLSENDEGLLHAALQLGMPLVSEDKKLLHAAAASGLTYYNALMMIVFLVTRGRFGLEEYPVYRSRLLEFAHYSESVVRTADRIVGDIEPRTEEKG